MNEVTKELAHLILTAKDKKLPAGVMEEARRAFLNWLGCAIGGTHHEASVIAIAHALEFRGQEQASVVGTRHRLDIFSAACVNGITSHVFDFDDTHLRTVVHPSPPIAPALLAYAEYKSLDGEEFLRAFAVGIEVACRIANAVCPAHYNIGWHSTSTAGVFGAAAAIGMVLDLDETQMCYALGLAGTQSAGLRENLNTMGKFLHPGRAAFDGMTAAFLAKRNFTASDKILEAPRGFSNVLSTESHLEEVTEGWGTRWEVLSNAYKPYPCGVVLHPIIDACLALASENGIRPEHIESVSLKVNFLVLEVTGKRRPTIGVNGKFSVFHCVAVSFIDRIVEEEQFTDSRVKNRDVVELSDRVMAVVDDKMPADATHVTVHLKDGKTVEKYIEHARGSLKNPLSNADIELKFQRLCKPVLAQDQIEDLINKCRDFAALPSVSEIARCSAPR